LSDAAWLTVAGLVSSVPLAAGEHLLLAGEKASRVFFIRTGVLREYYIDATGNEATRRFCQENQFSGSLADLISGGPAAVSIEALTRGEVWTMDWARLDAAAEQHPSLMKLLRRFAEGLYVQKMAREFEMLTLSAAERYQRFSQQYAGLEERLPRHMIATYLGISAVHLSRIGAGKRQPDPASPAERS
jgi:CRP-like cAMP-binding protein